tara:strand:+ start:209 stop:544 length:336 start_codon:yes stop_codon:yes gene_type:complete
MNSPMQTATPSKTIQQSTPNAPVKQKQQVVSSFNTTPKKLTFEEPTTMNMPLPGKPIQPYEPIEWVYPNDGESEFYTYEQMLKDWVPSDIEEDESSSDEEYFEDDTEYDLW